MAVHAFRRKQPRDLARKIMPRMRRRVNFREREIPHFPLILIQTVSLYFIKTKKKEYFLPTLISRSIQQI